MATAEVPSDGRKPHEKKESGYYPSQMFDYFFDTEDIPCLNASTQSSKVDQFIASERPVLMTNTDLVKTALHWDLNYLEQHLGDGDFTVYTSDNDKFLYHDEKKMEAVTNFKPPTKRREMKFPEFVSKIKSWKKGNEKSYLQQTLNDAVGKRIVIDFLGFNWDWINKQQNGNNWGPLTANLLLIGQEGNYTPVHYDEQHNLFAQVQGCKRIFLFPPSQFECLYPYPVYHPCDRQCQVDLRAPDFDRFPKLKRLKGYEVIVKPGDVLYIPMYWFHHVESIVGSGITTSITFWYKSGPTGKIEYPLKPQQKMAMMRNIEKMITEALNSSEEVPPFMQNMVLGRYT